MCNKLIIQGRNSKLFLLNFLGELIAYSSPVPDLLGTANVSSDQVYWEEQSDGLLTDEAYGLQDIHLNSILTYGKIKEMGKIDRLSIARPHQSTFYNKLYDHKPLRPRVLKSSLWGPGGTPMFFKAKLHEESKTGFKIINCRPYPVLFFSKN